MKTVTLRALEPEDLDFLYQIENDSCLWLVGNTNVPYSRYALHDYIAHASADIYVDKQVRLMIEDAQGTSVGLLDLVDFDPRHLRAEVGIVINPRRRREGLAESALSAALDYAHRILHLHQLYAIIDAQSDAARALFLKVGFSESAVLHHWLFNGSQYHDAILMQRLL